MSPSTCSMGTRQLSRSVVEGDDKSRERNRLAPIGTTRTFGSRRRPLKWGNFGAGSVLTHANSSSGRGRPTACATDAKGLRWGTIDPQHTTIS